MRQTINAPGKRSGRAYVRRKTGPSMTASNLDRERPKPSTIALVREALNHCRLDPRATPRSNQACLLFAVYYCAGLPFPHGWREASVDVLEENGIPATTVQLDVLYSAMNSDSAADFEGWPGIDSQLVRDLLDRH
ncbi:MAG: hypothetical protein R3C08_13005 [Hyphomonas sp.]